MWPTNTMPVMPYPAFYVGRYATQALEVINEEKAILPTAELEARQITKVDEAETLPATSLTLTEASLFDAGPETDLKPVDLLGEDTADTQSLQGYLSQLTEAEPTLSGQSLPDALSNLNDLEIVSEERLLNTYA